MSQNAGNKLTRITIGVITYQRPHSLRRLLKSLTSQSDDKILEQFDISICIVENGTESSSLSTIQESAQNSKWPISHHLEPRLGIPFARNKLVALASDQDFILFLDDDQSVSPSWLSSILKTQKETKADVIFGPVEAMYEKEAPSWSKGFFEFSSRGSEDTMLGPHETLRYARTGNALLRVSQLRKFSGPFNEAMAHCGGTDTHLFMRMLSQSTTFAWSARARTMEHYPASRINLKWLIRRNYRIGTTIGICTKHLLPYREWPRHALNRWAGYIAVGCTYLFLSPLHHSHLKRALCWISRSIGLLAGLLGFVYDEYQVIHGQ